MLLHNENDLSYKIVCIQCVTLAFWPFDIGNNLRCLIYNFVLIVANLVQDVYIKKFFFESIFSWWWTLRII